MGILQLNSPSLSTLPLSSSVGGFNCRGYKILKFPKLLKSLPGRVKAVETAGAAAPETETTSVEETAEATAPETETTSAEEEPPSVDFAFVGSVLLPDGTPDIHYRSTCGGQKLRDIMLDNQIDLYGPYKAALNNCAGGGSCGTCLVEVVAGKELLNRRTEKEREILKRKPKNWRLACQTIVGQEDSRGEVVIQTLPEWKAHEWEKV
ncbi:photosynthetic NDH subunit of subcomplex B 3, chloroplastic [Aristolochia californica]|uniref:photosynthetic NDH subunit of subcomplex B 3, chloroplastic n=1 Tax=Aristolochia californica TaxID=171875 RepID=UPI0035D88C90